MPVSLSAQVFDIAGQVYIPAQPDSDNVLVRRVTRVATLDGGAAFTDGGFSDADRTISLTWRTVGKDHNQLIEDMVRNYAFLTVAKVDGCFSAAPQNFTPGPAECTMTLLVKEKLT